MWFLKLTQMWCCVFVFPSFRLLCLAVKTFRGKEPTRAPKKKRGWRGGCLTRAFAPIPWRVTGEKPQDLRKLWQLYRKGETARVLGVYNRLQGTLEKWSSLPRPRRKPRPELAAGSVLRTEPQSSACAGFRRQFVSGSMGWPQDGVPGESDLVTSAWGRPERVAVGVVGTKGCQKSEIKTLDHFINKTFLFLNFVVFTAD